MRLRIDGILAMSGGVSGGKQWMKFANTSNRVRICLFYQNETTIQKSLKSYTRFTSLLHAERTPAAAPTVGIASK